MQVKRRRHTPEQVIRKLREAERLLASGTELEEVCRKLEISVQTYHRWKAQYHSMRPADVVELKTLRKENTRLKKIVADRGFGFIRPDEGREDIFFHRSSLVGLSMEELHQGDQVTYNTEPDPRGRGLRAVDVRRTT